MVENRDTYVHGDQGPIASRCSTDIGHIGAGGNLGDSSEDRGD